MAFVATRYSMADRLACADVLVLALWIDHAVVLFYAVTECLNEVFGG